VLPEAHALFNASVKITIGSGDRVLFWEDPWINGVQVSAIAPALLKLVRSGLMRSHTVQQGLPHNEWVRDVAGELTVDVVVQFLRLWTAVHTVEMRGTGADEFQWKWTASGKFSTRSAYRMFFAGQTALPGAAELWDSFAPLKYKFHGWLTLQKRCWTDDRLERRGLPNHGLCLLCARHNETSDHLVLQCPFSRDVWASLLLR
jgi:hypothetical protein